MAKNGIYLLNLGLGFYEATTYNEQSYESVKVSAEVMYRALKAVSVGTYLDPYTKQPRFRFQSGKNGVLWTYSTSGNDTVTVDWTYPSKDGSRKYPFSLSFEMDYGVGTEVYEKWAEKYKVPNQSENNQFFHAYMSAIEDSVITTSKKYIDRIQKTFGNDGIAVRVSTTIQWGTKGHAAPTGVETFIYKNQLNQSFIIEYLD